MTFCGVFTQVVMKESAPDEDSLKKARRKFRDAVSKAMLEMLTVGTQNLKTFLTFPQAFSPALECWTLMGVSKYYYMKTK